LILILVLLLVLLLVSLLILLLFLLLLLPESVRGDGSSAKDWDIGETKSEQDGQRFEHDLSFSFETSPREILTTGPHPMGVCL
jgi:hypothetical protein